MSFFGWLTSFGSGKKKKRSSERLSEKAFIPSGGEATTTKILLSPLSNDKGGKVSAKTHASEWSSAQTHLGKVLYILAGIEGKPG
jgi:hypothetical protein